jgi:cellulose synthase/poly-beta-1,6-N-acetylglucosamine synthase-like glycosyltransferase
MPPIVYSPFAWEPTKDLSMRAPDLAVIVTSFEMPWHLRRALESIAGQRTNLQLEVVIADDGSTDETAEVVKDFATAVLETFLFDDGLRERIVEFKLQAGQFHGCSQETI